MPRLGARTAVPGPPPRVSACRTARWQFAGVVLGRGRVTSRLGPMGIRSMRTCGGSLPASPSPGEAMIDGVGDAHLAADDFGECPCAGGESYMRADCSALGSDELASPNCEGESFSVDCPLVAFRAIIACVLAGPRWIEDILTPCVLAGLSAQLPRPNRETARQSAADHLRAGSWPDSGLTLIRPDGRVLPVTEPAHGQCARSADLRCRLVGEGGVPSGADLGDLRRPWARPF